MKINCKRINDLAIVVIDSKIYNRTGVTDEIWIKILETKEEVLQEESVFSYDNFLNLIDPVKVARKEKEKKEKEEAIKEAQLELNFETRMRKAKRIGDISGLFEYDEDGITYLKGFKHPMPKLLVEALLDANYNPKSTYTVESLVNFWKYLLLNPNKHVRKGLFDWIKTGKFALTNEGNIISYRNVNVKSKGIDSGLQNFVTENWLKVKRWKKSPKNYLILQEIKLDKSGENIEKYLNNFKCILDRPESWPDFKEWQRVDTLDVLYTKLKAASTFKPSHSGPYGQTIKIGEAVTMPREECDDDPNSSCSYGLHCKSMNYGLSLGSVTLTTLVNPYNVVAIPTHDTTKFRSCEYLPVGKTETSAKGLVEFEPGTYDLAYNGIDTLIDLLKVESLEELKEKGEISDEISKEDFNFVMKKAKETISKRVTKV